MSDEHSFEISKNGEVTFSEAALTEMTSPLDEGDETEAPDAKQLMGHPIFGSKHTYCCRMGNGAEQQQFRSYSWQAPLFCMRMASKKGYSSGSVSRGKCKNKNDDEG